MMPPPRMLRQAKGTAEPFSGAVNEKGNTDEKHRNYDAGGRINEIDPDQPEQAPEQKIATEYE
jgi:hypothetical protein